MCVDVMHHKELFVGGEHESASALIAHAHHCFLLTWNHPWPLKNLGIRKLGVHPCLWVRSWWSHFHFWGHHLLVRTHHSQHPTLSQTRGHGENDVWKWEWVYKYPTQYNVRCGHKLKWVHKYQIQYMVNYGWNTSESGIVNTQLNIGLVMATKCEWVFEYLSQYRVSHGYKMSVDVCIFNSSF